MKQDGLEGCSACGALPWADRAKGKRKGRLSALSDPGSGSAPLLLARRRCRRLDALVLAVVRHGPVLCLAELLGVLLRGFVGLRLGFRGLGLGVVGKRGQLRPHGAGRRSHCDAHDHDPEIHGALLLLVQCWACGATGRPVAVPALILPDLMSLYQYSWCSFAQASST